MTYDIESSIRYIQDNLSEQDLLAQLAEECTELAKACLKRIRALNGTNPTPVSLAETRMSIVEEIADVQLSKLALGMTYNEDIITSKAHRWENRLRESK